MIWKDYKKPYDMVPENIVAGNIKTLLVNSGE